MCIHRVWGPRMSKRSLLIRIAIAPSLAAKPAMTGSIVAKSVLSSLTAASTVQGARLGINVYFRSKAAPDAAFMDPIVIG